MDRNTARKAYIRRMRPESEAEDKHPRSPHLGGRARKYSARNGELLMFTPRGTFSPDEVAASVGLTVPELAKIILDVNIVGSTEPTFWFRRKAANKRKWYESEVRRMHRLTGLAMTIDGWVREERRVLSFRSGGCLAMYVAGGTPEGGGMVYFFNFGKERPYSTMRAFRVPPGETLDGLLAKLSIYTVEARLTDYTDRVDVTPEEVKDRRNPLYARGEEPDTPPPGKEG